MNSFQLPNGPERRTVVSCGVAGVGIVQAPLAELPGLRQTLRRIGGAPLPPAFLRHADDQTVTGIAAVFRALEAGGLTETSFRDWGVVAASRYMGRTALAGAIAKFQAEGAWGLSPHLIPHRSLHALSGTISQALKLHGPNFGSGGGPQGAADALLTAAALLHGSALPGVWVVLTGWEPEPILDATGQALTPDCVCNAVALALVASANRITLRVMPAGADPRRNGHGSHNLLSLEVLLRTLAGPSAPAAAAVWRLPGGGRVELERRAAVGSHGPAPHRAFGTEPCTVGAEKLS